MLEADSSLNCTLKLLSCTHLNVFSFSLSLWIETQKVDCVKAVTGCNDPVRGARRLAAKDAGKKLIRLSRGEALRHKWRHVQSSTSGERSSQTLSTDSSSGGHVQQLGPRYLSALLYGCLFFILLHSHLRSPVH